MSGFHQAVEEMARGYLEGPYELGAPEISLNDQTLSAGSPAAPGTWQLLGRKLGIQPFTAASLRQQAEAITEVIDCAVGMGDSIGDEAAILFAAAFYQAISFGRSVKSAFVLGKSALLLEGIVSGAPSASAREKA